MPTRPALRSGVTWVQRSSAGKRAWWALAGSADGLKLAAGVMSGLIFTRSVPWCTPSPCNAFAQPAAQLGRRLID